MKGDIELSPLDKMRWEIIEVMDNYPQLSACTCERGKCTNFIKDPECKVKWADKIIKLVRGDKPLKEPPARAKPKVEEKDENGLTPRDKVTIILDWAADNSDVDFDDNFVLNMKMNLDKGWKLTEKQVGALDSIISGFKINTEDYI